MNVFRTQWRRTNPIIGGAPLLLVTVLHMSIRGTEWRHHWYSTIDMYNFMVVLVAPIVAGYAAWVAGRFSRTETLLTTANSRTRAIVQLWLALTATVISVFMIGLIATIIFGIVAEAPGLPSLLTLSSTLPPMGLLGMFAALGVLIGWRFKSMYVAPVVVIGSFLIMVFGYAALPGYLLNVGGATATLFGLSPRPRVMVPQFLFYLGATGAMLILAAHPPKRPAEVNRQIRLSMWGLSAVGVVFLLFASESRFIEVPVETECTEEQITICVALGYADEAQPFIDRYEPEVTKLQDKGINIPTYFSQDGKGSPGRANISPDSFKEEWVSFTLVNAIVGQCDDVESLTQSSDPIGIDYWVKHHVDGPEESRPPEDLPELTDLDSEEANAWAVAASDRLAACEY